MKKSDCPSQIKKRKTSDFGDDSRSPSPAPSSLSQYSLPSDIILMLCYLLPSATDVLSLALINKRFKKLILNNTADRYNKHNQTLLRLHSTPTWTIKTGGLTLIRSRTFPNGTFHGRYEEWSNTWGDQRKSILELIFECPNNNEVICDTEYYHKDRPINITHPIHQQWLDDMINEGLWLSLENEGMYYRGMKSEKWGVNSAGMLQSETDYDNDGNKNSKIIYRENGKPQRKAEYLRSFTAEGDPTLITHKSEFNHQGVLRRRSVSVNGKASGTEVMHLEGPRHSYIFSRISFAANSRHPQVNETWYSSGVMKEQITTHPQQSILRSSRFEWYENGCLRSKQKIYKDLLAPVLPGQDFYDDDDASHSENEEEDDDE